MIVYELVHGNENHPVYQMLEFENRERQYGFLQSAVKAALDLERPLLSHTVIKALNYHAIAGLHPYAGEYRPHNVKIGDAPHQPPEHYRVQALMEDFVDEVNRRWENYDAVKLAAHVLWRLNYIHPFVNGNGRTARAACYFTLCLKVGGLYRGPIHLPALLRKNRDDYIAALRCADDGEIAPLEMLLVKLLLKQVTQGVPSS